MSDDVKKAAAEAIGDATSPEQKLERLFEFCRSKIKNINDDASGLSADERAKWKNNKAPADTLKRRMGTGTDIDMLFATLAIAAGFDARMANLADRSDIFFDAGFPDDYFISSYDIAVRLGETWRFYDPASTYVSLGMLRWQEEGEDALVSDPKDPTWVQTPMSPPEKSMETRTASFVYRRMEHSKARCESSIRDISHPTRKNTMTTIHLLSAKRRCAPASKRS